MVASISTRALVHVHAVLSSGCSHLPPLPPPRLRVCSSLSPPSWPWSGCRSVVALSPAELPSVLYLLTGRIRPEYVHQGGETQVGGGGG